MAETRKEGESGRSAGLIQEYFRAEESRLREKLGGEPPAELMERVRAIDREEQEEAPARRNAPGAGRRRGAARYRRSSAGTFLAQAAAAAILVLGFYVGLQHPSQFNRITGSVEYQTEVRTRVLDFTDRIREVLLDRNYSPGVESPEKEGS